MWDTLSVNGKLSLLAGDTFVDEFILRDNEELIQLLRNGASQEEAVNFINENF